MQFASLHSYALRLSNTNTMTLPMPTKRPWWHQLNMIQIFFRPAEMPWRPWQPVFSQSRCRDSETKTLIIKSKNKDKSTYEITRWWHSHFATHKYKYKYKKRQFWDIWSAWGNHALLLWWIMLHPWVCSVPYMSVLYIFIKVGVRRRRRIC